MTLEYDVPYDLIYVEQQPKAKNVTSKSIVQVVIFHVLSFTCVNNSFRFMFIFVENKKKERTQMAWRMSMGSFSQTVEWIIILFIYWNVLIAPSKPDAFFPCTPIRNSFVKCSSFEFYLCPLAPAISIFLGHISSVNYYKLEGNTREGNVTNERNMVSRNTKKWLEVWDDQKFNVSQIQRRTILPERNKKYQFFRKVACLISIRHAMKCYDNMKLVIELNAHKL